MLDVDSSNLHSSSSALISNLQMGKVNLSCSGTCPQTHSQSADKLRIEVQVATVFSPHDREERRHLAARARLPARRPTLPAAAPPGAGSSGEGRTDSWRWFRLVSTSSVYSVRVLRASPSALFLCHFFKGKISFFFSPFFLYFPF